MKAILQILLFFVAGNLLGQQGVVRGTVIEDETGEALIAVSVGIPNTILGTSTDYEGAFELSLDPGIYTLELTYISFQTVTITDVEVKAGEVNLLENIRMYTDAAQLAEVVITAEVVRSSEAALLTIKRKSSNLLDGISSAKFKKIGDSNAASAVKRVTGVSVEGGKYVYVRGLGDRYSKTMLNSVDIPGLDPDRNSLQIDIFPTNLLNNMVVYKSSVAELPADFTGGLVNIETKDFPEERVLDISLGFGYNPSMHLKDNFLKGESSSTDWLGYDDGTRGLPSLAENEVIPSPVSGDSPQAVNDFIKSFGQRLGAEESTSMPDFSIGVSYGDQKSLESGNTLGWIFSGTYKSTKEFYENLQYGEYQLAIDNDVNDLVYSNLVEGRQGEESIFLGGLGGLAFKTDRSKHSLTLLHLQNGNNKAAKFNLDNNSDAIGQSGFTAFSENLEYSQRRITNVLLNGEYAFNQGEWKLDWKLSPTFSSLTDPDIRKTAFTEIESGLDFNPGAGGFPSRIWRFLDETNLVTKADVTKKVKWFDRDGKIKFGASHLYKERDYNILAYVVNFFGAEPDATGNADDVLADENLFPNGSVYYNSQNNTPNPNEYNSSATNTAAYISTEFNPTSRLKATVGLRAEKFQQRHTGRDTESASTNGQFGNTLDNEVVLDTIDLFPSVNLIQSLNDNQNLRLSYSRSIARPSFKELSFAQILDPITNRIFNGGLFQYPDWDGNLKETRVHNIDLRWEQFMESGQLLSVGLFFKQFDNPIELVRNVVAVTSADFQPRNVGDGQLYGVEIELRKHFGFISNSLRQISFSTNVTAVQSSISMTNQEYNSRVAQARTGQEINDTRNMAGQSPFIINAGLSYTSDDKPFDMGLYYNVKGRTLTVVGSGVYSDVYTKPFHSLNFSMNKSFGEDDRVKLSLNVSNLLSSNLVTEFEAYEAEEQIFSSFQPGSAVGVGFTYSIF